MFKREDNEEMRSFVVASMLAVSNLFAAPVAVQSPDGQVAASFDVENGELFYSVSKGGKPVVGSSKVEIFAGAEMAVVEQSIRENDSSWTPVYGQFSSIRDHHRELTLSLTAGSMPVKLLCRAFDSGIGFRFVLSKESQGKELSFSTGYNVLNNAATYSGTARRRSGIAGESSEGLRAPGDRAQRRFARCAA